MQDANDDPFTDTLLNSGVFDFGGPPSAYVEPLLRMGLFNLDPLSSTGKPLVDGILVPDAFAGADLTAAGAPDAALGEFFAHHLFLDASFAAPFLDGLVTVSLEVPDGQFLSIDYMVLKVTVAEPSTVAL